MFERGIKDIVQYLQDKEASGLVDNRSLLTPTRPISEFITHWGLYRTTIEPELHRICVEHRVSVHVKIDISWYGLGPRKSWVHTSQTNHPDTHRIRVTATVASSYSPQHWRVHKVRPAPPTGDLTGLEW